jgi:predicted dehydrogenase
MQVKVGVIGAGCAGSGLVSGLSKIKGVEVVAISDTDENRRQEMTNKFGVRNTYADYRRLLDDKSIDVVYVVLPHYLHHRVVIDALDSGKHVICEKPMSISVLEADEMISKARLCGRKLFISLNWRFIPEIRKTKYLLDQGAIGRPSFCTGGYLGYEYERMSDVRSWKGTWEKSGGGVLIDGGYHLIDILNYYFGPVKSVIARTGRLVVKAENKAEDSAFLILEYESGVLVNMVSSFVAVTEGLATPNGGLVLYEDIFGCEGTLSHCYRSIDLKHRLFLVKPEKREEIIPEEEFCIDKDTHFLDCIVNGSEPLVTADDAREAQRIVEAAYESAKKGMKVSLEREQKQHNESKSRGTLS